MTRPYGLRRGRKNQRKTAALQKIHKTIPRTGGLFLRPEENDFFVRAFDFDAVGLDIRIVLDGIVDDAAIERAKRLEFDDVAPTADLVGGFLRLFHEGFAGLRAITTDIDRDLRARLILLEQQAVGDVL